MHEYGALKREKPLQFSKLPVLLKRVDPGAEIKLQRHETSPKLVKQYVRLIPLTIRTKLYRTEHHQLLYLT